MSASRTELRWGLKAGRLRRAAAWVLAAGLVVLLVGGACLWSPLRRAVAQAKPQAVARLVVDIAGLHSGEGRVAAAVYCAESGFPGDVRKACASQVVPARGRKVRLVFDALPAGEVAVSIFHDENANADLDTNFLGIPTEGWGTSRDAKAHFGPPSYDDARIALAAGEHKRIVVHMQY